MEAAVHRGKLAAVKTIHTFIYVVMVVAIFYILYAAIVGAFGILLYISLGLLALESIVFIGSGMKCPLTALAKRYGDPKGYVGDTLFPERCTKYTFRVFGTILLIGLLLLLLNVVT